MTEPLYWLADMAGEHILTDDGAWRRLDDARADPCGLALFTSRADAQLAARLLRCHSSHTQAMRETEPPPAVPGGEESAQLRAALRDLLAVASATAQQLEQESPGAKECGYWSRDQKDAYERAKRLAQE